MPTPESDPSLVESYRLLIPSLAELYDKFAHAIPPFPPDIDDAERGFMVEVSNLYDSWHGPKPNLHEFRKGVISRCKKYLESNARPQDQRLLRELDLGEGS